VSDFNRDYILKVTKGTQEITIVPPFRLQFSCAKSISGDGLNKLQCQISGLKESTRQVFHKDNDKQALVKIDLSVGYEGRIKRLFVGDLHRGSSVLTSNAYATRFEAMDGGKDYLDSYTSATVTGKENALNRVLLDMPNTTKGKVTFLGGLIRPKVLMGASSKLIEDLTGDDESFYIDNGKINVLKPDEVVSSYTPVISAETGLINTPEKEEEKVTFETMMNPFVVIGGLLQLQSVVDTRLDGIYKVTDINYQGDTMGNDWKQSVTCILAPNFVVI